MMPFSSQCAFICNYREHWFTIRRMGNQWFNLNSLLTGPELVSDTFMMLFLAQLQQEGYSIYVVPGPLPECAADQILRACPAVQTEPPRLLSEGPAVGRATSSGAAIGIGAAAPAGSSGPKPGLTAEAMVSRPTV